MEQLFPEIQTSKDLDKSEVFQSVANLLLKHNLLISRVDLLKPWGFYAYIDERQAQDFTSIFFPDLDLDAFAEGLSLQPKILGFAPQQRLSWQYHHRRGEVWRNIAGSFQAIQSDDDTETDPRLASLGDTLEFPQGVRHRAIGLEDWGIAAEIWRHSDPAHPSDEDDIVRVQDDYRRA